MRGKGKYILWPAYFDVDHSWRWGRRVPNKLALRGVKSEEVFRAAEDLGMNPILNSGVAYSKNPWLRTGVVLVDKVDSKTVVLKEIARMIRVNRASK